MTMHQLTAQLIVDHINACGETFQGLEKWRLEYNRDPVFRAAKIRINKPKPEKRLDKMRAWYTSQAFRTQMTLIRSLTSKLKLDPRLGMEFSVTAPVWKQLRQPAGIHDPAVMRAFEAAVRLKRALLATEAALAAKEAARAAEAAAQAAEEAALTEAEAAKKELTCVSSCPPPPPPPPGPPSTPVNDAAAGLIAGLANLNVADDDDEADDDGEYYDVEEAAEEEGVDEDDE